MLALIEARSDPVTVSNVVGAPKEARCAATIPAPPTNMLFSIGVITIVGSSWDIPKGSQ